MLGAQEVLTKADGKEQYRLCPDNMVIFCVLREDVRTANVIAAGDVTCLVINRE